MAGGLNTSSALSGTGENFDARHSLNGGAAIGPTEARTFQHTINIGSFINEINNQQIQQQADAQNKQQSESLANLNYGGASNTWQEQNGKVGAVTTFSNTIDNTEQSVEGQRAAAGEGNPANVRLCNLDKLVDQDGTAHQAGKAQTALHSRPQGSVELLKSDQVQLALNAHHQYHSSTATAGNPLASSKAGVDSNPAAKDSQARALHGSAPAKEGSGAQGDGTTGNSDMYIQDSPDGPGLRAARPEELSGIKTSGHQSLGAIGVIGAAGDHSEEPMIKI